MDFSVRFALSVLIVSCSLLGIIENYITYRTGSTVLRYSMGFNHPNTFASIILSLILEEAWLNKRKANGFYIVAVWCVSATLLTRRLWAKSQTCLGLSSLCDSIPICLLSLSPHSILRSCMRRCVTLSPLPFCV